MNINVSLAQGRVPVTVVQPTGDLDSSTYQQFESSVKQAIDSGARNVLVDLSHVNYMSSAGLRSLLNIFNLLHNEKEEQALRQGTLSGMAKSPHLKLAHVNKNIANVLSMAGFDTYLDVHKDSKEAIAAF